MKPPYFAGHFTRCFQTSTLKPGEIAISGLGGLQYPAPGLRGPVCFGAPLKKGRYPPVSSNIAMGNHLQVVAIGKSLKIFVALVDFPGSHV